MAAQVHEHLNLPGARPIPVLKASAAKGQGLEELWAKIEEHHELSRSDSRFRLSGFAGAPTTIACGRTSAGSAPRTSISASTSSTRGRPRRPSILALHWVGAEAERRVTYSEMADRSGRFARAVTELPLARGDRVLVILPRMPEWWETLIGLLKAGVIAIPGTTLLTPKDLAYRIELGRCQRRDHRCRRS